MNGALRKTAVFLALIAVLLTGALLYFKKNKLSDFNPLVREKLQSLVSTASGGLYRLTFDTLIADVVNSTVLMNNVQLIPDTIFAARLDSIGRRPADIFTISLKQLKVEGINIDDFLSNKKIDLDVLYLQDPSLRIDHKKTQGVVPKEDTASVQTVYQLIAAQMNRVAVKKIFIQHMNVDHHSFTKDGNKSASHFNDVNIQFDDVLIDSVTQYDSTRFLYAKNANIFMSKLQFPTADSLYLVDLDTASIDAARRQLTVASLTLRPKDSKEAFEKKLAFVKERYNVTLDQIAFNDIDWWSLVSDESFEAHDAVIGKAKIDVYTDRRLPPYPKSKVGRYPSQVVMKSPLLLNIPKITIADCSVIYTEVNAKTGSQGKITFDNCQGTITNVTNDSNTIQVNPYLKITAKGKLMNTGDIQAGFSFDMRKYEKGVFTVDMSLGQMDATILNSVTQPLGLFKIESTQIQSLSAHIDGTDYNGKGKIKFIYSGMKIEILKDEGDGTQKKKGFLSFIANAFIIKDANESATKTATYTRDIHKSFFSVIWKTILIGILKTIGYEEGADNVK